MIKRTLLFESKCSITTRLEQLIIKTDQREASIPIEDIGYILLEHRESYISIPAIEKLAQNNTAVIFCDSKHMPHSMLLNLNAHHLQHEIFTHQIQASEPLKKQLWHKPLKPKLQIKPICWKELVIQRVRYCIMHPRY